MHDHLPERPNSMTSILDLQRYPLQDPVRVQPLIEHCRQQLNREGLFRLDGLVRASAVHRLLCSLEPLFATEAFSHIQKHNVYFSQRLPGVPKNHPVRKRFQSTHHTLCADQLDRSWLVPLYAWPPLITFLGAVLDKDPLFVMSDPLARVNVMRYQHGEGLNWHFDRAEFATTLLLQEATQGGMFQYCRHLRSASNPNYDGVGAFLSGDGASAQTLCLRAGTLCVFRGQHTVHRVSPVVGERARTVAVFSYFERPDVRFSATEQRMFYGRAS